MFPRKGTERDCRRDCVSMILGAIHGQGPPTQAERHLLPVELEAAALLRAEPRPGAVSVPCCGGYSRNLVLIEEGYRL